MSVPEEKEDEGLLAALVMALAAPETPSTRLRERVVSSLRAAGPYGVFGDRVARLFDLTIEEAHRQLQRLEVGDRWGPGPIPGIDMWPVRPGPRCAGAIAAFVRLAPSVIFPRHSHVEEEISVVLEGGLRDSTGREIWRGGELYKAPRSEHSLVALSGGPCIAATIAFEGIEFLPPGSRTD